MQRFTTRTLGLLAALGAAMLYLLVTVAICVQLIPSNPHLTRRYVAFNPHVLQVELPANDGRAELAPQLRTRASAPVAEMLDTAAGIDGPRWIERSGGFADVGSSATRRWLLWDQLRSRAPPARELLRS